MARIQRAIAASVLLLTRRSASYVRLREVISFEQEMLAPLFGEGVGNAITEIKLSRVARTLSEIAISLARDASMYRRYRNDFDIGCRQNLVEPSASDRVFC